VSTLKDFGAPALCMDPKRIETLRLSFKEGTDDLREIAILEVVERLIGKGYDAVIDDRPASTDQADQRRGARRTQTRRHTQHERPEQTGAAREERLARGPSSL
jgi:UDP-glucose 6-dehydrogenase